jgi:L-serine kinase (ADP)
MEVRLQNGQKVKVSVVRIKNLTPHETTIDSLLDSVKRDLSRTGFQRDPLLIDESTLTVLDGMHRRAALEMLGAKLAICASYDYLNRAVILERWLRYFIAPDMQLIDDLVRLFDLEKSPSIDNAIRAVDASKNGVALLSRKESYVGEKQLSLEQVYKKLSDFDRLMQSKRLEVQFRPEAQLRSLFISESVFVLYPMKLYKEQILAIAKEGRRLPFKTTRHTVPVRPMGMYFPINKLAGSELRECNEELERIVRASKVKLIEKGQWYEGRRYSERLAVFKSG